MKLAIYIEDRVTQVVLTPENDFEEKSLKSVEALGTPTIMRGAFYTCNGGWTRHKDDDDSLIIRFEEQPEHGIRPALEQ